MKRTTILTALLLLFLPIGGYAGIPEPGLTIYGIVKQDLGGAHARLTTGSISITITPAVGTPLTLTTTLTNVNNQFSFVLDVPFESGVTGFPVSSNALALTVAPSSFTRGPVTVDGVTATVLPPATNVLLFGQADRGSFDRMDVSVVLPLLDTDGDGLPNQWEEDNFGNPLIGDKDADSDQPYPDGFTNLEEFLAGTDPNNPDSVLWVEIEPMSDGSVHIRWRGAADRYYSVMRSAQIDGVYAPIAIGVPTAEPFNTVVDPNGGGDTEFFYNILVE